MWRHGTHECLFAIIELEPRSIGLCPLACSLLICCSVIRILMSNLRHQGVIRIWICQHREHREEHLRNRESGRPILLENIETDESLRINIRMINLRCEDNAWRLEGIVDRELNCRLEDSTSIWRICWS